MFGSAISAADCVRLRNRSAHGYRLSVKDLLAFRPHLARLNSCMNLATAILQRDNERALACARELPADVRNALPAVVRPFLLAAENAERIAQREAGANTEPAPRGHFFRGR